MSRGWKWFSGVPGVNRLIIVCAKVTDLITGKHLVL